MDVASLAELLHETAERRDPYEKSHAPHNLGGLLCRLHGPREHGRTPDKASEAAGRYMD
jgi:hypothetical protein